MGDQKKIIKKTSFLILLVFICSIPGFFLSFISLKTAFPLFEIARANFSSTSGHISDFVITAAGYRPEHLGGDLIQYYLISLTNWALDSIALLPLGSLLSPLLFYGISKKLSGSVYVGACVAIFSSWFYPRVYIQFGTLGAVWTNILFLSFLLIYYYWLQDQKLIYFLLLLGLFLGTFFHYHTTPIWMIAIIFITFFLKNIVGKNNKLRYVNISWAAPLIFGVIYFQFDTVVYGRGLKNLANDAFSSDFFHNVILRFITPILRTTPENMEPFEVAPVTPYLATASTLIITILITIPVVIWCLIKIISIFKSRDINRIASDENDLFCWAMIGAAFVHTLMYGLYGTTDIRVLQLTFPLILPLIFQKIKLNNIVFYSIMTLIATLAIIGFYSFSTALNPYMTITKLGLAPNLIKQNEIVLADANTYGSLLAEGTRDKKLFGYVWPTPKIYEQLVYSQKTEGKFSYVFADKMKNPITTNNWVFLEAWENNLAAINENVEFDKIYDSDYLTIFQRKDLELPDNITKENISDSLKQYNDFSYQWIWLFFSLLLLFFLPGIAFINLFRTQNKNLFDFDSLAALTVGFSVMVITFIGYILNFTPLGLNQFIVSDILFIIVGITIPIFMRKTKLNNLKIYFISSLLFFVILLLWSFIAINVNQLRLNRESNFIEFYITQDSNNKDLISLNIVNRKNESIDITIEIDNGINRFNVGDYIVSSNSALIRQILISNEFFEKRVNIYLYQKENLLSQLNVYFP